MTYEGARALAIVSAKPERVTGRFSHSSTGKPVTIGLIVEFAGKLASAGATSGLRSGQGIEERDCHVSLFSHGPCRELSGEAVALHAEARRMHWRVTVTNEHGFAVASVQIDYAVTENANPTNAADRQNGGEGIASGQAEGTPLPEPSQGDKRREHIAAAAADVIARKGFANATMREIADAAGMHVPTMYQYVGSKDEMLELVYSWTMATVRTDVDAATASYTTATEKIRATISATIDKGDRFRHRIGVLNRELRSLSPQARTRVLAEYRKLILQIANVVKEGIDGGEFRQVEPEVVANLIDAACDIWPLRQFAVGQFGVDLFRREIGDLIVQAIRK
ncbi:TetR/AcrR family transcriptional regulator [Mesorhizobium sp. BAC0120]|uniref:TetR/AcrR family transcriptional regulator n=1 Tax=Mesorhizobium sp. BAC0120 TaxID=3090670 RepID=UPI00298C8894|nr:TetR/AcrR family transcriptional regulator [Mesorhizobium sp. BAC0120]MDW6024756.1 TetR/AcrR family transcriptional regulator [Mesorhizobium sp. BAC0120]